MKDPIVNDTATDTPGLVVPIELSVFCVSEADQEEATGAFSGATVDYSAQTVGSATPAYLGSNVWRSLNEAPAEQLQAGVHLHWKLPAALTTATVTESDAALKYPPAPNRWLVTRFEIGADAPTVTSWVVESDALNSKLPAGQPAVPITIPLAPGSDPNFSYLGQCTLLSEYEPQPVADGVRSFRDQTGAELSAVSNGVPTFAAYYPECSSVFGFFDPIVNLPQESNLMYVVTGWYDTLANDPATLSGNLPESHGWTWDGEDTPEYTLYSGSSQEITWNKSTNYVLHQPNQQPISAKAAMGNTPSEALSAYLEALDPDSELTEQILTAFQAGLLPSLTTSDPGLLSSLGESLHDQQFQTVDGGTIYTIVLTDTDGTDEEATDLSQPLADALNQLNLAAEAVDETTSDVVSFQWQMFANWYRYFEAESSQSAIFNTGTDLYKIKWPSVQTAYQNAQTAFATQMAAMEGLLEDTGLSLKAGPAARYWQPTDPVLVLASPDLELPWTDGSSNPEAVPLVCRETDCLVSKVMAGSTLILASSYSTACTLPSSKIPYSTDCTNLLTEACLLNAQLASNLSGQTEAALETALQELLANEDQLLWTIVTGLQPASLEVGWWEGENPWMPLLLQWSVQFAPVFSTEFDRGSVPPPYPENYFTANYTINPETGSFVSYAPEESGIVQPLDPTALTFGEWAGQTTLSNTSAYNLAQQMEDYLAVQSDDTLTLMLDELTATPTTVQPLSGFTLGLLMQEQIVQLQVAQPGTKYDAATLTKYTNAVLNGLLEDPSAAGNAIFDVGPSFNSPYNPIRGGWFRIPSKSTDYLLYAVDVFGQKRGIIVESMAEAESMTAYEPSDTGEQPIPGLSYAAPRLAQPARLLFEWVSAAGAGLVEMNNNPASTPICGWLLPNHLNGGFFLYDGVGKPLGSLQLDGEGTSIVWQSAPGDNATINLPIDEALATVNPTFKALAEALSSSSVDWFLKFWSAIDAVYSGMSPDMATPDAGLSVLIGQPVAVAQTALRLDLKGRPSLNQSWSCVPLPGSNVTEVIATDNAFTDVKFPVVLGDMEDLNDGLIGYFLPDEDGDYAFSTFYSEGAEADAVSGVVQPEQDTILLTATPKYEDPEPAPIAAETLSMLLLIDPRAPVHATTGILPTQTLQIPSDIAVSAMNMLEMSFLVAPVLRGAGGLALPVPREPGYQVSFIKEELNPEQPGDPPVWAPPESELSAPTIDAVWGYTPQIMTEGWLRLNQVLLSFDLHAENPNVPLQGGATQKAILTVKNLKPLQITFHPGEIVEEGETTSGSVLYIHFGQLVAQADVAGMSLNATGWSFKPLNDLTYGNYWGATPTGLVALPSAGAFDITITNFKAVTEYVQGQVATDYVNVEGVNDGVFVDLVTLQQS